MRYFDNGPFKSRRNDFFWSFLKVIAVVSLWRYSCTIIIFSDTSAVNPLNFDSWKGGDEQKNQRISGF